MAPDFWTTLFAAIVGSGVVAALTQFVIAWLTNRTLKLKIESLELATKAQDIKLATIEKQTNGMIEQLVDASHRSGVSQGRKEKMVETETMVKDVATVVANAVAIAAVAAEKKVIDTAVIAAVNLKENAQKENQT